MGDSVIDALFTIWRWLDALVIASAMGLAPVVSLPTFYFTQKADARSVLKAVLSSLLVWALFGLVATGEFLFKGYTANSYEGYGALLFGPLFLFAVVVALASVGVLATKYGQRWPIVAIIASAPSLFLWASANHANYSWSRSDGYQSRTKAHEQKTWRSAHPLTRAVEENDERNFVAALAEASREELEVEDDTQRTPLQIASANGNVEMVRRLLDAGASQRGTYPGTPADLAAGEHRTEILELLFSHGGKLASADVVYNLLDTHPEALENAHFESSTIEKTLVKIADQPFDDNDEISASKDRTALDVLERFKFDANARLGDPPQRLLRRALMQFWKLRGERRARLARIVDWLLEHGTDAKDVSDQRDTTIVRAFLSGSAAADDLFPPDPTFFVLRTLISHGAPLTVVRRKGEPEPINHLCSTTALLLATFHRTITTGASDDTTLTASSPSERIAQLGAKSRPKASEDFIVLLTQMVAREGKLSELSPCFAREEIDPAAMLPDIARFLPTKERAAFRKLVPSMAPTP